jgi:hypothetical protein
MLNEFKDGTGAKKPAGILSLLRMPFRQGALCLVFQVVFQVLKETSFGDRRIMGHG